MSRQLKFVIFIDYDNLLDTQKSAGILDIVRKALIQLPVDAEFTRITCDVRIYGGWYEGVDITHLAQMVTVEIQNDFPTVIRLPDGYGKYIQVAINAELAVALMIEPGHHLFNTLRRRGRPGNIRVEEPHNVGCVDAECVLPLMKKLIKKRRCPKQNCGVLADDLIYRKEQKIVDTMLSCDLIQASFEQMDKIILISGDDDFLPPLRTVILNGKEVIRFHPKQSNQRATFPHGGAQLLELDL
ncbi:MAG: NYN domain-containing protein [Gammaproteobacteria bacterium]|nr:NYN domain-containing protein [Gammaproteobacteria bacterium]